jgi:hypothetical protein
MSLKSVHPLERLSEHSNPTPQEAPFYMRHLTGKVPPSSHMDGFSVYREFVYLSSATVVTQTRYLILA